ncbi:protein cortex-like isoform X3 [Pararge aegeria]|uniref:protein cortex-like isoform X3 n=1 Tax=Pararge aegeria TaxID=116150 RepID=UPI0019D04429|nr:protein cortex-like isoform X3 [Pararge aegeria]
MDCTVFGRKNVNTRNRVDRFVLPREYVNEMRRRSWPPGCDSGPLDLNYSIGEKLKHKRYANYLDKALGVHRDPCTPLRQLWPCIPRKKSFLSSADSILDLPKYSDAIFPELLDWSKDNILVAALGSNYHKLSCSSQTIVSQVFTRYEIQCCKFDPRGELLLLGTHMGRVEIHNNARNKRETEAKCQCVRQRVLNASKAEFEIHYCSVTAVDWSPTGNSFVTGCSFGVVMSLTRAAEVVSCRRVLRDPICLARVSPDARYAAVTAVNSAVVLLLTWPALDISSTMNSDCMIKTITWHPWRSALLGVGAVTSELQARVVVWNAPTNEVQERKLAPKPFSLDAMLFSDRTGELVASLWNSENALFYPKICSQLVVLSNPETVVDQWGEGPSWPDRVRTMVFNPDGTKLATATSDEDLIIWNFLPEDKVKKNPKRKRFSALPVYQDQATHGFSIR